MTNPRQALARRFARLPYILAACACIMQAGFALAQEAPAEDDRAYALSCPGKTQGSPGAEKVRSVLDLERSKNAQVASALREAGDALTAARPIQHWAYFATDESRAQFIALIAQQFSDFDPHMNPMSTGKTYAVTFWQTGVPDANSMAKITTMLELAAESCNGDYDGWETQVVR